MKEALHIFLSPHYDDAALSCGGSIAQLSRAGERVMVATLFGGKPDYDHLSPFARMIHGRPMAGHDLIEQRRLEERLALALLGADSRLGVFLDCIYRQDGAGTRWLYTGEEGIFGAVNPADDALAEELVQWLAALASVSADATFYAPLAIGNHVDHQIARNSAVVLQRRGHRLLYYEDYPYSARDPAGLERSLCALAERSRWQATLVPLTGADLQRKIDAVLAYRSQLEVLFPGAAAPEQRVATALRSQALMTGNGRPGEQFWQMMP